VCPGNLWQFNVRSDGGLDVVVLLRRRSEVDIKFRYRRCICHQGKGRAGRQSVTEETVDRLRETFTRSPKKSVRTARRELNRPQPIVRKILRKRLQLYPYKLQLVQNIPIIYTHHVQYIPFAAELKTVPFPSLLLSPNIPYQKDKRELAGSVQNHQL
jgi:hypothetical protein